MRADHGIYGLLQSSVAGEDPRDNLVKFNPFPKYIKYRQGGKGGEVTFIDKAKYRDLSAAPHPAFFPLGPSTPPQRVAPPLQLLRPGGPRALSAQWAPMSRPRQTRAPPQCPKAPPPRGGV